MSAPRTIPELLAPAGSLDAVRAAVANGADAVYLGAEKFNARDEGAQLTLDELDAACALAHGRGVRIYLTLNTLVKPAELFDALDFLGDAIDRGIDAAIVQDLGLVRLIRRVYPGFEIHGSTQMTVHDAATARLVRDIGVERVVLARENTLDDLRGIRAAVDGLGIETFVHGALCISYSGQCFMSGMISERSANRGSCAQSCRKGYTLRNVDTGAELDAGYLISAKDLAAHDSLAAIAAAGIGCLKIEGRKKRPEYVATVTRTYRDLLSAVARGDDAVAAEPVVESLVQIYSRGFTPGMYQGRAGRSYITREQPDNRGVIVGTVASVRGDAIEIAPAGTIEVGDGIAFERAGSPASGGFITRLTPRGANIIVSVSATHPVTARAGDTVVRTSQAALLDRARSSFAGVTMPSRSRDGIDVAAFGAAGAPLKLVWRAPWGDVTVRSDVPLAPATKRALDVEQLRAQLGRLGETPFALRDVEVSGLRPGLFIPVSELNRLRQDAVEEILQRREWDRAARAGERTSRIEASVADVGARDDVRVDTDRATLSVQVWRLDDARAAADAGATEIVLDPFLRHPLPPVTRVRALIDELRARGVAFRLRLPTIVRPEERARLDKWLALDTPILTGHVGMAVELAKAGRDVTADYGVNCFNEHTAAILREAGVRTIVASLELTTDEISALVEPWKGAGFAAFVYGRPEGMTIEHCVLSAAFDRTPTTCRDLCVRDHTNVTVTDPAGYEFAVATDSACRNRLLHSRPVEASEYMPRLWSSGIRSFNVVFNVAGDDIAGIVRAYASLLRSLENGSDADTTAPRAIVGRAFTRGHFARAV